MFVYGMKYRPFSIGYQSIPMYSLLHIVEDTSGLYWYLLYYAEPLNDHQQEEYKLDYLGESVAERYIVDTNLLLNPRTKHYDCNHDYGAIYKAYQKGRRDALKEKNAKGGIKDDHVNFNTCFTNYCYCFTYN